MSEYRSDEELFALLDDKYARAILTQTSIEPMSAKTLSNRCDASLPTIYRRADRLVNTGLLDERTKIGDQGHHYSVFKARLDHLTVDLEDGELTVDVETTPEDPADRFTDMWEEI